MRKTIAGLTALLTVTACGGRLTADDFRSGLPTGGAATLELPGDQGQALTADDTGTLASALEGETSQFYRLTRGMTRTINGGVGLVLLVVRGITLHRPTSLEASTAVWGPFRPDDLAPNEWRLTVDHLGDQDFEYVLEGRPKDAGDDAWVVVLSGHHTRVVGPMGRPIDRLGTGDFLIDFDALSGLPEQNPDLDGGLEVAYARPSDTEPVSISVSFHGVTDAATGRTVEATYDFHHQQGVGGDFQFALGADLDGGPAAEQLTIKSRWTSEGAGRSDVKATGGDLASEATASECWDTAFASTYMAVSFSSDPAYNYGEEAAGCVFATPSYPSL